MLYYIIYIYIILHYITLHYIILYYIILLYLLYSLYLFIIYIFIRFIYFRGLLLRVEIDLAESGHLRPLVATRLEFLERPLAVTFRERPLAVHLAASGCHALALEASCGHLLQRPLAANRVAASGCEWLHAGRNTGQSWHLEKIGFAGKAFFSSLEVG